MVVLLNWLTQGLIVAIAAAAGLRVMPASPAKARYAFTGSAYLLVLALPAIPLLSLTHVGVPGVALPSTAVLVVPSSWWTAPAIAVGCWIVWSGVVALRLLLDVAAVRRARQRGIPCPDDLLARLPSWSRITATGRPVPVIISNDVRLAAVLGCGSPVIAIAPRVIEQLSATDLDRVLVHEWAHVQRRDHVAQFAQQIARIVVGWHPAAWWLERQLDFEREAACDEIAVAVTGSAKHYATCLTALAALPQPAIRPLPQLAALSSSGLRRRLLRILAAADGTNSRHRAAVTSGLAAALAAVGLTVGNMQTVARTSATIPVAESFEVAGSRGTVVPMVSLPTARPRSRQATLPSRDDSGANVNSTANEQDPLLARRELQTHELQTPPGDSVPLLATRVTVDASAPSLALPAATASINSESALVAAGASMRAAGATPAPWMAAADAGAGMGRRSQRAGVATAGFFSRFGKSIARSF